MALTWDYCGITVGLLWDHWKGHNDFSWEYCGINQKGHNDFSFCFLGSFLLQETAAVILLQPQSKASLALQFGLDSDEGTIGKKRWPFVVICYWFIGTIWLGRHVKAVMEWWISYASTLSTLLHKIDMSLKMEYHNPWCPSYTTSYLFYEYENKLSTPTHSLLLQISNTFKPDDPASRPKLILREPSEV